MTQTARLEVIIDSQNAERRAQMLGNELINIEQRGDYAGKAMDNLSVSIRKLTGMMAGLITVNQAIARADGYTQNAARIRNATQSAEEYKLVQDRLFESTKSTFRALSEAQEVYLGLAGGMKALGYQTKDTLDVSDSLSFSFVANAARADQAQSAIDALNKSMAKGKIDANAWISIVSAADNIISDMAKTTGMAEAEIRKLGAEGKISLEDLIKTLKLTKDSNKELADAMENSLADGLTTLSNAVTKYVGELNMAMGLTNNAAGILGVFADNIDIVMNAAMAGGLAYLTKSIITNKIAVDGGILSKIASHKASLANAQAEVTEATAAVNAAEAHLANVKATNTEAKAKYGATAAATRYAQAQAAVTAATNAQTEAQKKLSLATINFGRLASGAYALVGGPIGAITLGVAGLTAAYSLLKDKSEKLESALVTQGKAVSELVEEYRELDSLQRDIALRKLKDDFDDLKEESNKAQLSLYKFNEEIRSSGGVSKSTSLAAKELFQEYNAGRISSGEYYEAMKALNIMSDNQTKKLMNLTNEHSKAKAEYIESSKQIKALRAENDGLAKSYDATANAVDRQTEAQRRLSAITKELREQKTDAQYTLMTAKNLGGDIEEAKRLLEYRKQLGLGSTGRQLNAEERKVYEDMRSSQRELQAYEDKIIKSKQDSLRISKQQTSEYEKQQKLRERKAEEVRQIQYEYTSEDGQKAIELQKEISRLQEAGQTQYINIAKTRYAEERKLAKMNFEYDLVEFSLSEEKKLRYSFNIREQQAIADTKLTRQQTEHKLEALKYEFLQEKALLELAKEQRLFQARQALMTETDLIRERYRLEREEILKTSGIKDDEKKQRIKYSEMSQQKELNDRLKNSTIEMARINAEMKGVEALFEINQTKATRYQANENWYDSETAVIDYNEGNELDELQRQFDEKLLSQQQFEDQKTAIIQSALEQREAVYNKFKDNEEDIDSAAGKAQLDFYMGQADATLGAFQGLFGAILGEQSTAYRTMYAASQAFALAKAGMNLWESASGAYAKEDGTVWQKAGAAARAVIDQGTFIAMIQAASPKGFSDGGYTGHGGKYDEAGIVHKGEVVWSQEDIKRWGGVSVVEAMRKNSPKGYSSGGLVSNYDTRQAVQRESRQLDSIQESRTLNLIAPKVTIINNTAKEFDASTEWDGNELTVKLEEFKKQNEMMMDKKITQSWRDAERQGGALDRVKRGG